MNPPASWSTDFSKNCMLDEMVFTGHHGKEISRAIARARMEAAKM